MCDFRPYLGYAHRKDTNERVEIPDQGVAFIHENIRYGGEGPVFGKDDCDVGVYMVSATGAFWGYYDGEEWHRCYDHPTFEFQFGEARSCLGHLPSS